jgi:hypothetical protein
VEIDGPDAAEVAAAGHSHLAVAKTAQQGAYEVVGGTDLPRQLVVGPGGADAGGIDLHRVAVDNADLSPKIFQNLQAHGHIGDLGQVLDPAHAVHHQSGGNNGDGGILRAADLYLAKQGLSALYNILRQSLTLFSRMFFCGGKPSRYFIRTVCPPSAASYRRRQKPDGKISGPYRSRFKQKRSS